jgi:outer membrane receptor for ferrienterochelin and colicins
VPVSAQEEVMDLEEVVVTASRYEESIMETPVSIEVIDQEEIEESSARNLAELLNTAGGVHIKDNGGITNRKDIIIRGMRGDQILILLDGQPYNNSNDGGLSFESIPVEFIEKIEVLKSPASAIYGANAMGGVINIITKNAENIEKTNLKIESGSYDTQKYNLSHSFVNNNHGLTLIYDKLSSDGHREKSSIEREDLFLKYNYQISKYSDLILSFKNNESETDYPGQDSDYLSDEYLATLFFGASPSGSKEDNDQNINFTFKQNLEAKDRKVSFYNNNRELKDLTLDTTTDINKKGFSFMQTNYFNKHTLSYGLDFIEDGVETDNYNEDNLNKAIFIQDKYVHNEKTIFNLGARYDDHEQYGSEFSPRLGMVYKFADNWNFNANVAESFKAPSYMDLYFPGYNNPNLDPEKSVSYDFGFKYMDDICQREISFFRRDIDQLIKYNFVKSKPENINSATIKGIEFNTERQMNDNLDLGFNYTYLDANNDESQEQIGDMPYHKFGLNMKYIMNDTKYILNNRFTGERTDGSSNEDMDSYFISDFKIIKTVNDDTELKASINNLFDKDYEVVDGYPMPGRNYMLSISTKF